MTQVNPKKRILLMTTWLPATQARRSMYHDLADEMVRQGFVVDIIAIDWRKVDQSPSVKHDDVPKHYRLFRYQSINLDRFGVLGMAAKWIGTSLLCIPRLITLLATSRYDVVVAHTPAAFWADIFLSRSLSRAKFYLIQWDFTPYHQRAIGMMRDGRAFKFLLGLETQSLRRFDVIGCMSPMNIAFLKKNYKLKATQQVEVLPIWACPEMPPAANRDEVRSRLGLPLDKKLAVFGGTLSAGRGIEDIVEAAKLATVRAPNLVFVIVGSGPLEHEVQAMSKGVSNLIVLNALPRTKFLDLLQAADVGIVATERDTGVPTFPSKTLDYFRANLPVVASIEQTSDYGSFLEAERAGIAILAGHPESLLIKAVEVSSDLVLKDELSANGRRLLQTYFNVTHTVRNIVKWSK